ncbi:hypothetical protein [Neobacillus thermocopriae]|uniref:Uncharacterized protein n=1 Tax=Neobacillus thermocopriae TaxID=1215031 RepID=A0A6B3TU63_9BACI|nr:hypothetical protein [Neobacillus thermocopriae]MED3623565.1 hypothetical protein [Neobacillus thermocopriae]MED3714465.1 hypothetical protein [Neobacillus thermocopriae]NEX79819.1 hypothetical protein [Neobacillus thermocopriae]
MENTNKQKNKNEVKQSDNEAVMDRVNQSYDKITQDVKEMLNESNNQLS